MSEINELESNSKSVSRRNFLVKAGAVSAGIAVTTGLMGKMLTGKANALTPIPWPYVKLDPEVVRKRAFDAYFEAGCCYGAAKALLVTLAEALPDSPWNTIPLDMFKYGAGGALSWGTLCGALNGSLYVMNLATGTQVNSVANELLGWYSNNPFPSTLLDSYSSYKNQIQTIAHSPLCHNSVSQWCAAAGKTVNSSEKKNRCAKLTGDTAAKAVQILNALLIDKNFKAVFQFDPATQDCMTCHNSTLKYDDEQGKMECNECHSGVSHDHNKFNMDECIICHE